MMHWNWALAGLLASLALLPGEVRADRIRSRKVVLTPQPGVRGDLTVPYTTNGRTTLGVYQGVSPRIYSSPVVNDPNNPGARPVYNLPFWGGVQGFGNRSNGAVPRTTVPYVGR